MAFTFVTITHTFQTAADLAAAGEVDFQPVEPMHNGNTIVAKKTTAVLSGAGVLSQKLAANTDPGTLPTGTTYKVTERITGQSTFSYYIQIPHDQGPTLDLRTLAGWVGNTGGGSGVLTVNSEAPDGSGNIVLSSADIGAQPISSTLTLLALAPVSVTYAASVTLNAASSCFQRMTVTGDLTITDIINGVNGQPLTLELLASGGTRSVTFPGGETDTILSGQRWMKTLRYNSGADLWVIP